MDDWYQALNSNIVMNKYTFLQIFVLLLFSVTFMTSCQTDNSKKTKVYSSIQYAKGFSIVRNGDVSTLTIYSPYQNAKTVARFDFSVKKSEKTIQTPIKRIVVTSTTHVPMLELLGEENSIIGFPSTGFVSSNKTRKRIDSGFIKEIGIKGNLNTEILLDLKPEAIVSYAVNSPEKSLNVLKRAGIPIIYNGDWLEESPLGKAEWIKFFGLLFAKEKQADSIFTAIEKDYLEAISLAKSANLNPSIVSGAIMSGEIWNLPAGESYVAQFLRDANTNYLWQNTSGKGSLQLSFERVFEKAKAAKFWIAPGYFSSKNQMVSSNKLYAEFDAFKNDNIYTPTTKSGPTGGVLYYELATIRPDLVLKDLIKITHPELLPDYELTFFEKLK